MNEQASIYWRRRMVAIGGVVIALVVLGWAAGGFFGDGSAQVEDTNAGVKESPPPSSPPPSSQSQSVPPSSSATTSQPAPTSSETAPPPPPPPPPDPGLPCPDQAVQLSMEVGQAQYRIGQRPVLRLVVTNAGPVACTRDISRALREVLVFSADGGTRIWSSNDCYGSKMPDSRILQAGERRQFEVRWAGRTSSPGCPAKRTMLPAGTYSVIGRLGALASAPVPLVLV
jgi:hypothetical protein